MHQRNASPEVWSSMLGSFAVLTKTNLFCATVSKGEKSNGT